MLLFPETIIAMMNRCRINPVFLLIALLPAFPSPLLNSQTAPPQTSPPYMQMASEGLQALQHWYSPQTGMYAEPTDWWNAANAMTVLVDFSRVSHSRQYLSVVNNTFERANGAYHTHDFLNASYDDEGWWALAWVDAYDQTGDQKYLKMAETIFANIADQWDQTCNGGVWWDQKHTYKNAITNELFLSLSAALANRVKDTTQKHHYLDWAQREWHWFKASGMINSQHLVNDGLNSKNPHACVNNGENTWTYNQGVILGGLVELNKAVPDASLIAEANAIAHAAISGLSNSGGILQEKTVSGKDTPQFKGVFLRNLSALYQAAPEAIYKHFADANAQSIWQHDQGPNHEFGGLWQGPFDSGDATRQTAALDALIAAASMK